MKRALHSRPLLWLGLLALAISLTACNMIPFLSSQPGMTATISPPKTFTLVPTLMPSPTIVPPSPTPTLAPTATPNVGILDARFVRDVTIPDGTVLQPGVAFVKTWEIKNTGEVAWPEGVTLKHVDGPALGPIESVSLRPREPGETVEISVEMQAPTEPGLYTSYWQLCVDSQCFGSRFWVQIRVRKE